MMFITLHVRTKFAGIPAWEEQKIQPAHIARIIPGKPGVWIQLYSEILEIRETLKELEEKIG